MDNGDFDPVRQFQEERRKRLEDYSRQHEWLHASRCWLKKSFDEKYVYNFDWLGRPIIQFPSDMVAVQELIWKIKPELIIETGIAHGGSLILSASMLAVLDVCDAIESCAVYSPKASSRSVVGIDIDIRAHNRHAIEEHPLSAYITMIEGSSIDAGIIQKVRSMAEGKRVMVFLDSNHTHEHVLSELLAYAPLVSVGSYCIVFDTIIEELPSGYFQDRPWDVGNSPKSAIDFFLQNHGKLPDGDTDSQSVRYEIDTDMDRKLIITAARGGYLKRVQ